MPWRPRTLSETGLYHVTQRGTAHGLIFESDDDRRQFLRIIKKYRDELGFRVLAWCLMDDHIHLVLDIPNTDITHVMKCIDIAYAKYFNQKTKREGHLFQGAFKSKPIVTEAQLMATIHYVHQNPEVARICRASEYHWSSFQELMGRRYLVDTEFVLALFGGLDGVMRYGGDASQVAHTGTWSRGMTDAEVLDLVKDRLGEDVSSLLAAGGREQRDEAVRLLDACGVSARQIARIVGLGRVTVLRIVAR